MIKKYSLLTILVVIILVGSSAEHFLAQTVVKMPPSIKGKRIGNRGIITTVKNPPKPPKKKKGTLQPLELEPEPEQSSRWELTGEIKVTGTETYPYSNGSCTKSIDRTYKSKVILDYMQEGFPSITDPNELAKIQLNLPNSMSVGNSRTMWMVSPLNLRAASSSENVHIRISDNLKCSYKGDFNPRFEKIESEELWIFNDYLPSMNSGNTVSLDKGQKAIYIGLHFFGGGKTVRHVITMTGQPLQEIEGSIPSHPQIEGVTTKVKLPATAAFLMNPHAGFKETFPTQDGDKFIYEKVKEQVTVTYTFRKL